MRDNDVALDAREEPAGRAPSGPVISRGTRVAGIIMVLVLAIGATLDHLASTGRLGDAGDLTLAALTLVPLAVAVLILSVTRTFAASAVRTHWTILGLGMLSVGIGNVIFIVLYLTTGTDPYPSVADVFTLAGYALFATGVFKAVFAYRGLLDIRNALIIATGVAMVALAVTYFTVIGPYVIFAPTDAQTPIMRVMNTLYPVLDMLVLLMPAIALGLLVSRLGAGRVAWPWWFVVASASTLAITDTVFAYATYHGYGRTVFITSGYAAAPLLLGFAVLVARDIYKS